jgi:uncharacterized protein with LGFP repeats
MKTTMEFTAKELECIIWTMLDDIVTLDGEYDSQQGKVIKRLVGELNAIAPSNSIIKSFKAEYEADLSWIDNILK